MKTITFILLFLSINCVIAQVNSTDQIIEAARLNLSKTVGQSAAKYFQIDEAVSYKYQTSKGKFKWKPLTPSTAIKGEFVICNVRFVIDHPDYQYLWVNKFVHIELDQDLNHINDTAINHIPEFIRKGKPSNWLPYSYIEQIIDNQELKKPVKPNITRLEYDIKGERHYWKVFNTIGEERCASDVEILEIDPISGLILKHYEEHEIVMHCF
ncbi:MAG: hypothetical protein ABJF11_13480 [Reichenbachiella sp.]|uniref:hypothetical protein n=1 Tax=Reichenbachiella sp. TaxID=2184521 RepID=UPI003267EB1A